MALEQDACTVSPEFGQEQFRVPKVPVPVAVLVEGGGVVEGSVHAAADAGAHAGRERVIDLLDAPDPFLPVTGSAGPRLVGKDRIIAVRVASGADAGLDDGASYDLASALEVRLAGVSGTGAALRGTVYVTMPPGRTRVLDYLNETGPFVPLVTGEGTLLVARRYIVEVRPV